MNRDFEPFKVLRAIHYGHMFFTSHVFGGGNFVVLFFLQKGVALSTRPCPRVESVVQRNQSISTPVRYVVHLDSNTGACVLG